MSRLPPRALDVIALAPAIALVSALTWAWSKRWSYPYDLEWMEGGMLAHAWRLARGMPMYPDAGPAWIPYVYPPGYAAVLAGFGAIFGVDYDLGRAISIGGTLLAAAAAVRLVHVAGGGLALGLGCAAVFLGCYEASGAFYDLVRPDALAMGLLAWAITLGLERHRRAPEIAGIVLMLAFVVKHHSAAYGVPIALGIWARDGWRPAARFGAWSAIPAGLFTIGMQVATHGHFLRWLLVVPASHPLQGQRLFPGAPIEAARWLLGACVAAGIFLWIRAGRTGQILGSVAGVALAGGIWLLPVPIGILSADWPASMAVAAAIGAGGGALVGRAIEDGRAIPWGWVYGGGVGVVAWLTTGLMRAHNGGFLNVLMPLHWVVAVALGVVIARSRRRWPGPLTEIGGAALVAGQLLWMAATANVGRLVPDPGDVDAGNRVVAQIRETCGEGPVLSPFAPWLPVRLGLEPSWHLISLWDIVHKDGPYFDELPRLSSAVRKHRWTCVIDGGNGQIGLGIDQHYRVGVRVRPARALQPKTGWRVRPTTILVPRETP